MINLENRFFIWEKWEYYNTLIMVFKYVKFIEDFGIFKKGEEFYEVFVNYNNKCIVGYASDNEVDIIRVEQDFNFIPIPGADSI